MKNEWYISDVDFRLQNSPKFLGFVHPHSLLKSGGPFTLTSSTGPFPGGDECRRSPEFRFSSTVYEVTS